MRRFLIYRELFESAAKRHFQKALWVYEAEDRLRREASGD
jgi:hypothetical protein